MGKAQGMSRKPVPQRLPTTSREIEDLRKALLELRRDMLAHAGHSGRTRRDQAQEPRGAAAKWAARLTVLIDRVSERGPVPAADRELSTRLRPTLQFARPLADVLPTKLRCATAQIQRSYPALRNKGYVVVLLACADALEAPSPSLGATIVARVAELKNERKSFIHAEDVTDVGIARTIWDGTSSGKELRELEKVSLPSL